MRLSLETMSLPVAPLGPDSVLPSIFTQMNVQTAKRLELGEEDEIFFDLGRLENILPYQMKSLYTRSRKIQSVPTAVLENEFLRAVFLPDYPALKAGFGRETAVPGQSYAGRACTAVLLDDSDLDADWLRVFVDDETGFVLLCEAPLFRLRTALLETLPVDDARLMPPDGLLY